MTPTTWWQAPHIRELSVFIDWRLDREAFFAIADILGIAFLSILCHQCRILLIYTVYLTFIILNHNHNLKSINHFFSFLKSISFGHARFTLDSDNSHYYCGNFRIFHTQFHMIVGLLQLTLKIHTNVSTVAMPKNHLVCCQWWVVKNTATYFTGICHNLLGPYFYLGYNSSL